MKTRTALLLATLSVSLLACGAGEVAKSSPAQREQGSEVATTPLSVYVVNYPLAYFAQRIGGELVDVEFPVPAGEDPAYWSPDAETVTRFQQADLILLNGAGYAKWVDKVSLPTRALIDTSAAFTDRLLPLEKAVTHSHGPGGEHEHQGYAFTVWLDPQLAIEQARAIAEAFSRARPASADSFEEGFGSLAADLLELDARLEAAAAAIVDEPLIFSHPVYQYLIAQFGLDARSVHWEPDETPGQAAWLDIQKTLSDHRAAWMLWEAEPMPETASHLRELGVESLVFDPCANAPGSGDFLSVMDANAAVLESIAQSTQAR